MTIDTLPSQAIINGVALTGIDLALSRLTKNTDKVFQICAINTQQLGQANGQISLNSYIKLYETIQEQFQAFAFGAQFGALTRPKKAGLLGYLALHAPNLGQAITDCARYLPLILQGFDLRLEQLNKQQSILRFSLIDNRSPAAAQINQQGLAWVCNIIRGVLHNGRWQAVQTHFSHGQPAHHSLLKRIFGPTLFYQQPSNALIISNQDLQIQNPRADKLLYQTLKHQSESSLSHCPYQAKGEALLLLILREQILSGDTSLNHLAQRLGLTPRALQSQLKHKGMSYSSLLKQSRDTIALEYLANPSLSIAQIALSLGYSETAAFSHAFKNNHGQTPKKYRHGLLGW